MLRGGTGLRDKSETQGSLHLAQHREADEKEEWAGTHTRRNEREHQVQYFLIIHKKVECVTSEGGRNKDSEAGKGGDHWEFHCTNDLPALFSERT